MFGAGLDVHCCRSWIGIAYSRHLGDGQHMRPSWKPGAIAVTLCDVRHGPAIDLKIESEIPSEVRRSIYDEAARREMVIRPEVPTCGPPCATVLMKIAHPKTNIRRTFLAKLCFDFMIDTVSIELGFCQQVAAEALKNNPKLSFRCKSRDGSH